jgi:cell division protein FtsN
MARKKRKAKTTEAAPGWAWMLMGLSIGLAVALVVYLRSGVPNSGSSAFASAREAPPVAQQGEAGDAESVAAPAETAAAPDPDPAPRSSAEPDTELDFYDRLREIEVRIPATRPLEDRADIPPGAYKIQAGSFQTFQEADRMRARLALLGIESQIERAIVDDDLWQRVIIGPMSDRAEINRVLRTLSEQRIEAMPPQQVTY